MYIMIDRNAHTFFFSTQIILIVSSNFEMVGRNAHAFFSVHIDYFFVSSNFEMVGRSSGGQGPEKLRKREQN